MDNPVFARSTAIRFAFQRTFDPECKEIVERANIYSEMSFLPSPVFTQLVDLNSFLVCWLTFANAVHGHPVSIRTDNGPEMTCHAIADWCRFTATGSVFLEPGSPWQNAFMESFNGKLRDALLAIEVFHSLLEAKVMAEDYRKHYNTYRPHSSLGYRTPNEFTLDWNNDYPGLPKALVH